MSEGTFVKCEVCGKRLIERLPNGLFRFRFGKKNEKDGSPVDMEIHGSLRMKCLRRSCGHINVLNYFPIPIEGNEKQQDNQP